MKGEKLSMLYRKGRALYIDALPDIWLPSTTSTGLFGFFNVTPTFRSLLRDSSPVPALLNVRAGAAQYVEFGRGGKSTLSAFLFDHFNKVSPEARVRLVGQPERTYTSDSTGKINISDIDLAPGLLTLETEAPGYPSTWHTLAWDPLQRILDKPLFLLSEELVNESAWMIAGVRPDRKKGQVFGGAEASLFDGRTGCATVHLFDDKGKEVPTEKGPFAWGERAEAGKKGVCLTAQDPRYAFYNLESGEYVLRWIDAQKKTFRSHVFYVGVDRVSVVIN